VKAARVCRMSLESESGYRKAVQGPGTTRVGGNDVHGTRSARRDYGEQEVRRRSLCRANCRVVGIWEGGTPCDREAGGPVSEHCQGGPNVALSRR